MKAVVVTGAARDTGRVIATRLKGEGGWVNSQVIRVNGGFA